MLKVYQTIVDKEHGNCMQAAIASLFEKKLEEVPNFIEYKNGWAEPLFEFLKKVGYNYDGILYNMNFNRLRGYYEYKNKTKFYKLKKYDGVNGYFCASVLSPKYYVKGDKECYFTTHAVIIDRNLNIIHDPNPEYHNIKEYPESKFLKYKGIIDIYMINKYKSS